MLLTSVTGIFSFSGFGMAAAAGSVQADACGWERLLGALLRRPAGLYGLHKAQYPLEREKSGALVRGGLWEESAVRLLPPGF